MWWQGPSPSRSRAFLVDMVPVRPKPDPMIFNAISAFASRCLRVAWACRPEGVGPVVPDRNSTATGPLAAPGRGSGRVVPGIDHDAPRAVIVLAVDDDVVPGSRHHLSVDGKPDGLVADDPAELSVGVVAQVGRPEVQLEPCGDVTLERRPDRVASDGAGAVRWQPHRVFRVERCETLGVAGIEEPLPLVLGRAQFV